MASYRRDTLQKLAKAKLADARLLFEHRRYSNAYYLGGYAVELGLKAALARQFTAETLPDRQFVMDSYTHDLAKLVSLAGLRAILRTALDGDSAFAANWAAVSAWSEASRYESIDPFNVTGFMKALDDPAVGVFQWVTAHW